MNKIKIYVNKVNNKIKNIYKIKNIEIIENKYIR